MKIKENEQEGNLSQQAHMHFASRLSIILGRLRVGNAALVPPEDATTSDGIRDYLSSQVLWGLVRGDEKAPVMPVVPGTTRTTTVTEEAEKEAGGTTTWKKIPTLCRNVQIQTMPHTYSDGIATS